MDLSIVLKSLTTKRPIFHSEADFQHSLAWEIREHYPDSKIRLETKIYGANTKVYLDILVYYKGLKYAIELKYKTRTYTGIIDGEEFYLNNQGAQDIGRYDVLKDLQRLEQMVQSGVVDEGLLLFLTNDASYYSRPEGMRQTVDQNYRIYEGKSVRGQLSWSEHAGAGTMKGRENPISLQGQYVMNWETYSQLDDASSGQFRYLMLTAQGNSSKALDNGHKVNLAEEPLVEADSVQSYHNHYPAWFKSFTQKRQIPKSQYDLTDKLTAHLRDIGFSVQNNREVGRDKIDIHAKKDDETIVIEVRYKTALLKTIFEGQHVDLKKQYFPL
ncbi:hypothetical protein [Caldalkalibacillus salinus]|uniref:hypothetical protein n=1 Tax=Caldalkalibacillus salinus TaxID=2803787 RepID=UPI001923CE3F|nr:hypothetical protein [Caldalkalibacillus salinus]